ncbi:MAG: multidrug efflux RND transporter permease subunit [Phycisphaerales bacterium]
MLAKFFIDRPVFAMSLSILIVLAGAVSLYMLPIEQYPTIVPPTIQITANYPGADAETVASSVAAPIEQQLSGINNLLYFRSLSSNDGSLKIVVTFEIGTDQDIASVEVQNRLAIAQPRLPNEVVRNGITVTKSSTGILAVVALQSDNPQYDDVYLANYATINLLDALKRVPGVGDATVFGNKNYAMRVWVNPDKLVLKHMTVSDVAGAIREQNAVFPAGTIGQRPDTHAAMTVPAITQGRLNQPQQYDNIILRADNDGSMVRLSDVAQTRVGPDNYSFFARLNDKPTAFILVSQQVGANALATIDNVYATMNRLEADMPGGIRWSSPFDTTPFIRFSINEVVKTLLEAVALVVFVVFIFLQSWRATLIPLLAVPVAIIGTFAGMLAFGFSINTLTLFGLVLAIGIVVDDAIVVVENVERIMDHERLPPREATLRAMQQVTGPIIAIVLVLTAVFVPVTFLGGLTGQLYRQFAVTIAVSVVISGIVALTLSPALCRLLLKPSHARKNLLFRGFNTGFEWITGRFAASVRQAIRSALVVVVVFGILLWAMVHLSQTLPTGLLPEEDQGYILAAVVLPDGASLDRTDQVMQRVEQFMAAQPMVKNIVALGGMDFLSGGIASTNSATLFIRLKDFDERTDPAMSAQTLVAASRRHFAAERDGLVITFNAPPIRGLGQRAGFEFELESRGNGNITDLSAAKDKFIHAAAADPLVTDLNATLRTTNPQLYVQLDRDLAKIRGVPITQIFDTLQAYLGALYVNDYDQFGRIWRVQLQAQPAFRADPQAIQRFFVRNAGNQMVPLSGLVRSHFRSGPNNVTRFNGYPSVQITGAPAPGLSTGQAMSEVGNLLRDNLPDGYGFEWSGASYQEIKAGNQAPYVLAFGIMVVFLVLAAQYEKWTLPLAVLLAVPVAVLGALMAIKFRGLPQDIYFQVGLLTLVGLSAKNAILIVEFCLSQHRQGMPLRDAAVMAARLRFRPIVMTSLAFILGVVPLAISTGAGAAARHSIGTGVIGGMVASTFVGIFFVPVFYVFITRFVEIITRSGK